MSYYEEILVLLMYQNATLISYKNVAHAHVLVQDMSLIIGSHDQLSGRTQGKGFAYQLWHLGSPRTAV